MKFRIELRDPFGAVTGQGEIETANSVLDIGYGVMTGRRGTTQVESAQLTEAERAEQIRMMCQRPYDQALEIDEDARAVPGWRILMTEA